MNRLVILVMIALLFFSCTNDVKKKLNKNFNINLPDWLYGIWYNKGQSNVNNQFYFQFRSGDFLISKGFPINFKSVFDENIIDYEESIKTDLYKATLFLDTGQYLIYEFKLIKSVIEEEENVLSWGFIITNNKSISVKMTEDISMVLSKIDEINN